VAHCGGGGGGGVEVPQKFEMSPKEGLMPIRSHTGMDDVNKEPDRAT
jgi:hypothetical protein